MKELIVYRYWFFHSYAFYIPSNANNFMKVVEERNPYLKKAFSETPHKYGYP